MSISVGEIDATLRLVDFFTPALARAEEQLDLFATSVEMQEAKIAASTAAVDRALNKMTFALSGEKIQGEAAAIVASLDAIGGKAFLTATELKRVNLVLDEAVMKSTVMGGPVPVGLQSHAADMRYAAEVAAATAAYEKQWLDAYATVAIMDKEVAAQKMAADKEYATQVAIATKAYEKQWMDAYATVAIMDKELEAQRAKNAAESFALSRGVAKAYAAEATEAYMAEQAALKAASMAHANHVNELIKTANVYRTLGRDMVQTGQAMSMYITAPLVIAGAAAATFSAKFEQNMVKLVTMSAVTEETMRKMADAVKELAPAVGIGPIALSEALLQVTSTGIRSMEAMKILEVAAKGSAVGLGEVKDVAMTITSAMAAYAKSNLTAAEAGDILYGMVVEGKGELDQFASSMGKVVGMGAMVGVTMADLASFIATFTRTGGSAAEAVTALRQVLLRLEVKETANTRKAFKEMGQDFDEFRALIAEKGLTPALIDLINKFGATNEQLGKIFPNIRGIAGVMTVAGAQAQSAAEIFKNLDSGLYKLNEGFSRATETVAFKWGVLVSKLQLAAIELGEKLQPQILKIIDVIERWIDKIANAIEWYAKLQPYQQDMLIWLTAFVVLAGPVIFALGQIARGIGLMMDMWVLFVKYEIATKIGTVILAVQKFAMALIGGEGLVAAVSGSISPLGQLVIALVAVGSTIYGLVTAYDTWMAHKELADAKISNEERGYRAIAWVYDNLKIKVYSAAEAYRLMGEHAAKLRAEFNNAPRTPTGVPSTVLSPAAPVGGPNPIDQTAKDLEKLAKAFDLVEAAESRTGKSHEQFNQMLIKSGKLMPGIEGPAFEKVMDRLMEVDGAFEKSAAHIKDVWTIGQVIDEAGESAHWSEALAAIQDYTTKYNGLVKDSDSFRAAQLTVERDRYLRSMKEKVGITAETYAQLEKIVNEYYAELIRQETTLSGKLQKIAEGIPKIMVQAIINGDWTNAFAAIGAQIGSALGKSLGKSIGDAIGGMGKWGGIVGEAFGSLLGPVVGWGMDKLLKTEGKAVNDLRDTFIAAQGGYIKLHQALIDAGADSLYFQLQSASNMKDYEAAVKAVTEALAKQEAKLAEIKQLNEDIASTQAEIDELTKKLIPTWSDVNRIIEKYGIDVNAAGKAIQQLRLDDASKSIINDWETWQRAGGEMGIVAQGMAKEVNRIVQESAKFGTTIPANMQPVIQKLIDMGLLVDKDGKLIKDMSNIKFGDPIKSEADIIKDAIMALTDKLNTFIDRLAVLMGIKVDIPVTMDLPKVPELPDLPQPGGGGSGPRGGGEGPILNALGGDYWVTKPTLFIAGEAGPERATFTPAGKALGGKDSLSASSQSPTNINITIQALDPAGLKKVVEQEVAPMLVSAYRRNVNSLRTRTRRELVDE